MRKIIHIDMDCFYAAVEMRDNPALREVPIAIGGSRESRGVISTCNYPARAFGVRSAMPTGQALKLCPQLVLLRGNMEKYRQVSQQIQSIFHRFTDKVEPLSLDEAYLDVSDNRLFRGSATLLAEHIRQTILLETGLTASAGVAPNKFLAKVASDENKPNGLCVVSPDRVDQFVANLPLRKIPGVGQKTSERLAKLGLYICADVQTADIVVLLREFGSFAELLRERSRGVDEREVKSDRERKSIGVEHTFSKDLHALADLDAPLQRLFEKLERRVEGNEAVGLVRKLGVKLKFQDFQQTTLERSAVPLCFDQFRSLLADAWPRAEGRSVRLVGIHVGLKSQTQQLNLPFCAN